MNHIKQIIYESEDYKYIKPTLIEYLGKDITEYIIIKYLEFGKYKYYCCECMKYCKKLNNGIYCTCGDCGKHYCQDCIDFAFTHKIDITFVNNFL